MKVCFSSQEHKRKDTKGYSRDSPEAKKPSPPLWSWVGPSGFACARKTAHTKQVVSTSKRARWRISICCMKGWRLLHWRSTHHNGMFLSLTWSPVPAKWIHTGLFFCHLLGTINWNLKSNRIPITCIQEPRVTFPFLHKHQIIQQINWTKTQLLSKWLTVWGVNQTTGHLRMSHRFYLALTASGGRIPGTKCSSGEMKYPSWI